MHRKSKTIFRSNDEKIYIYTRQNIYDAHDKRHCDCFDMNEENEVIEAETE